jgi:two-component system response regulator
MDSFEKHNLANEITVVNDGAQALDFLYAEGAYSSRDPDELPKLVLLDLKLPLVDGLEVLRHIRADERTRNVPVVVLTSSSEERDIVESYALGVNSYIVKPVDFEQFTEAARTVGLYWLLLNRLPTSPRRNDG